MNQVIERSQRGSISTSELGSSLLSRGIPAISTSEAAHLLGVSADHVRQKMGILRRRGEIVSAGRGIWVVVPPEKKAWGAPEPIAYIDSVMKAAGTEYCIGWLSAAELYGASHQAPQIFQIATDRPLKERTVGRSLLRFFVRQTVGALPKRRLSLPAGTANVAAPEAVALMLASDEDLAGGIDNAATVICELAESGEFSDSALACAAALFSASAARRVGFILEKGGYGEWSALAEHCASRSEAASYLSAKADRGGRYNDRWMLFENREVDADL